MKHLPKLLATFLVAILMTINFNINYSLSPVSLQVTSEFNTAEASWYIENHKMRPETCWTTGQEIQICRYNPPFLCVISDQDTCSEPT